MQIRRKGQNKGTERDRHCKKQHSLHLGFLLKTPLTICTTYFCIICYPITYFLKQQSASIMSQFLRVKDSGAVWLSFSDLRSLKRLQPDGDWAEVNSKDSLTWCLEQKDS